MSRRLRSLKRLRSLREKQRDGAAAGRASAEHSLSAVRNALDAARESYAGEQSALAAEVAKVTSIRQIELLSSDRDSLRTTIRQTQHDAAQARLVLERSASELLVRERALRTCEKSLARVEDASDRAQTAREQRDADDRVNARRKRTE